MATAKTPGKYTPAPEFLDACHSRGMSAGNRTGKVELAIAKTTVAIAMGTKAATQGLIAGHKASR